MNNVLGDAITFKKATFYWEEGTSSTLETIDLNVGAGKLIAVIGPVGSGKSSLLSAILGEMYKSSGSIDVKVKTSHMDLLTKIFLFYLTIIFNL